MSWKKLQQACYDAHLHTGRHRDQTLSKICEKKYMRYKGGLRCNKGSTLEEDEGRKVVWPEAREVRSTRPPYDRRSSDYFLTPPVGSSPTRMQAPTSDCMSSSMLNVEHSMTYRITATGMLESYQAVCYAAQLLQYPHTRSLP